MCAMCRWHGYTYMVFCAVGLALHVVLLNDGLCTCIIHTCACRYYLITDLYMAQCTECLSIYIPL